jgi:hypothetical protein
MAMDAGTLYLLGGKGGGQSVYPVPPHTRTEDFKDDLFKRPSAPGTETLNFDRNEVLDFNEPLFEKRWDPNNLGAFERNTRKVRGFK